MCQARVWNKLYSEEIITANEFAIVSIIAERSDYEVFKIAIKLSIDDSPFAVANKIKKAHETLESYRNCDCTAITGECIKHKKVIETPINASTISDKGTRLLFGRK